MKWRFSLKFSHLFVKIKTRIKITTMHSSFISTILPYHHHIFEWNWCEKFYFHNSVWSIYEHEEIWSWIVIVIISLWHLIVYYVLHLRSILHLNMNSWHILNTEHGILNKVLVRTPISHIDKIFWCKFA